MANNISWVFFVEKDITVFEQIYITDTCRNHCLPAWLAAPPMPPHIKIRVSDIMACVFCVFYRARFTVVLGMTSFAKFVPFSGRNILFYTLAFVSLMIAAAIGPTTNDDIIFYNQAGIRHFLV